MSANPPSHHRPGLKHPGRWIWLILLVPVIVGLGRLRFDVEVLHLLPAELPVVQGLKLHQQHFANTSQLVLGLKTTEAELAEKAAAQIATRLREQTNLVAAVTWEPPWMNNPVELAELVGYLWFNQPPKVFGQLTNRLAPDNLAATLAETREQLTTSLSPDEIARLSYDPFGLTQLPSGAAGAVPSIDQGREMFSSPDNRFRIIFIQAQPELGHYREAEEWLAAIRPVVESAVAALGAGEGALTIGYTGRAPLLAETARGMLKDITTSAGATALIIAALFWLAHRRVRPMLWLLALLGVILGSTLALGGLIFGAINLVSMGFAAILLGLAVDYGVVHYQEALAHPNLSIAQVRHAIAPSIFWAATTTIAAFLVLNFGGLPGLGQLGTLVGLGVGLAATIMIFEYLPPLFPDRKEPKPEPVAAAPTAVPAPALIQRRRVKLVFTGTAMLLLLVVVVLWWAGPPRIDPTANALGPRRSEAYAALEHIQTQLGQDREPVWLMVGGSTVGEVAHRLERVEPTLQEAVTNQFIAGFTLPAQLWPRPENQEANRGMARQLVRQRDQMQAAAETAGFAPSALRITEEILQTWQVASGTPGIFWPSNQLSRWIFERATAHTPTHFYALGLVNPGTNQVLSLKHRLSELEDRLPEKNIWLTNWQLLGSKVFSRVEANLWKVVGPMVFLVLLSLWLAFRRWQEILLSLGVLLLSGACLLVTMSSANWSWNLMNLMAIPLILGTGVDYSIFMLLGLRRHHGDWHLAYTSVGRALLLCGATAIAAFGSLAWSTNAGMASLGRVCAVGIAYNMLIAVYLAPAWWQVLARPRLPDKES